MLCLHESHFTHEPRGVTMNLREAKRSIQRLSQDHFQDHVVWPWALECSVKLYVLGPQPNDFS